jgi:hypothetical protein
MAVNKPTIAAGATTTREQARAVVLKVTSTAPPEARIYRNENGVIVSEQQLPEREGQMLVFRPSGERFAYLFVVVDIQGTLTWAVVSTHAVATDSATGKPWDPLANQYSILAY